MLFLASLTLLTITDAQASSQAPKKNVLALGDSVTFGFQSFILDPSFGFNLADPNIFVGYPELFVDRLNDTNVGKKSELVNFACPGETSDSMISGYCSYNVDSGLPLKAGGYTGSQLDAAEDFLLDNRGQVSPIFVSIGANDGNALIAQCGGLDLLCVGAGTPAMLNNLAANTDEILDRLTSAAPDAQIIVLEYYNPYVVADPATDAFVLAINDTVAAVAAGYGVETVDAYGAINGGGVPGVCAYTNFCTPYVDIHTNDLGNQLLADLFWDASGFERFE